MHGLVIPPREVINASTLARLLTASPASEEQRLLSEFYHLFPDRFEEMLSEIVPDFAPVFDQEQSLV
jgi:hypothetical protein